MKNISIPPIYEEDIIDFTYTSCQICIKYNYEGATVCLNFDEVYMFEFYEFEYINDTEWQFGLVEYKESSLLTDVMSRISPQKKQWAFGGEMEKICHYKLVIDDVGMYNILCKKFAIVQK